MTRLTDNWLLFWVDSKVITIERDRYAVADSHYGVDYSTTITLKTRLFNERRRL